MSNIVGVRVPSERTSENCAMQASLNGGTPAGVVVPAIEAGVVAISDPAIVGLPPSSRIIDREPSMRFLGYAYRFFSNFVFLALVYYSLNFMEKYQQRAIVAILVLIYASMRAVSALRSFYFFQRIERLELEARRLAGLPATVRPHRPRASKSSTMSRCVTTAK